MEYHQALWKAANAVHDARRMLAQSDRDRDQLEDIDADLSFLASEAQHKYEQANS